MTTDSDELAHISLEKIPPSEVTFSSHNVLQITHPTSNPARPVKETVIINPQEKSPIFAYLIDYTQTVEGKRGSLTIIPRFYPHGFGESASALPKSLQAIGLKPVGVTSVDGANNRALSAYGPLQPTVYQWLEKEHADYMKQYGAGEVTAIKLCGDTNQLPTILDKLRKSALTGYQVQDRLICEAITAAMHGTETHEELAELASSFSAKHWPPNLPDWHQRYQRAHKLGWDKAGQSGPREK